eukprot:gene10779-13200_t
MQNHENISSMIKESTNTSTTSTKYRDYNQKMSYIHHLTHHNQNHLIPHSRSPLSSSTPSFSTTPNSCSQSFHTKNNQPANLSSSQSSLERWAHLSSPSRKGCVGGPSTINNCTKFPFLSNLISNGSELLVQKICSWILNSQQKNPSLNCKLLPKHQMEYGVYEILEAILTWIVEDMQESEYIIFIGIYFADKYVKIVGIKQSQVLWLLLIRYVVHF